jgi:hypothetical protein
MSETQAGAEYVRAITALPADRRTRSAFQDLVLRFASPGASLFDFGAGPGIDARFYAERGFSVGAYDVDPVMCNYFSDYCGDLIQAGHIALDSGTYRDFIGRCNSWGGRRPDLITSNFAPLNLIENLGELFRAFHALSAPQGKVLASVLSPYYIGDMKYGWWWRNLARLWQDGHYSVRGVQAPIVRRRLADLAAQSAPYFTLTRVFSGCALSSSRQTAGVHSKSPGRAAWLRLTTCRYMFLLFEKDPRASTNR